jgi:class 3 adenylate cyclase
LDGDDHWFFFGDTGAILDEIRAFVQTLGAPTVPECTLATILLIEYQNEAEWEGQAMHTLSRFDSTYAYLHQEVVRFRGSEVSCQGGFYMATFDGPTRAIHCAQAIMKTTDPWQVTIRVGLHTGECEYLAGELTGMAIKIVHGLVRNAPEREILVSSTVKDLVVGSKFQFTERGRQVIEGVSGEWGIYVLES